MKIITDDIVYVQKIDLVNLILYNSIVPISILYAVYGKEKSPIILDSEKYDFIAFSNQDEIECFKNANWLLDYDNIKDLTEAELCELYNNLSLEAGSLEQRLNLDDMGSTGRRNNLNIETQYQLLSYKAISLREFMLFRQGIISMNLPMGINYPEGCKNSGFSLKKSLKQLIKHFKRNIKKNRQ